MSKLSPQAQALVDAVEDHGKFSYRDLAAAALRAAALYCKRDKIILLSLADELENT